MIEEVYVPPPEQGTADALSEGRLDAVETALAGHPDWLHGCLLYGNRVEPMWYAAYGGHADVLAWLIAQGAEVDVRDEDGRTPLWWTAIQIRQWVDPPGALDPRFVAAARVLLAARADPDLKDNQGRSPDDVFRGVRGYGLRQAVAGGPGRADG